ncbi:MAG TPA: 50S ribosomal protein L29 [Caldilineae bacterium]|jgi:large subunit ribosomal protein L29|nr:50S ribosomal protein L29 [Caldilineae bacterium]
MKPSEIRAMTDEEIARRLDEAYQELFNLRFQHAIGQLRNTARLRQVRRDIARLRTILRERELAAWYESMEKETEE